MSQPAAMNFTATHALFDVDGVFVWNLRPDGAVDNVWWVPRGGGPQAFRDGARSNFTVDGVRYHWAWLSNQAALHEAQKREWRSPV